MHQCVGPSPKLLYSQMYVCTKFVDFAPFAWATLVARPKPPFQLDEFIIRLLPLHSRSPVDGILTSAIEIQDCRLFPMSFWHLDCCVFQLQSFPKGLNVLKSN